MKDLKSYEPFFGEWYIERPIFENEIGGIYEIRKKDSDEPAQSLKVIRMPEPGADPEGNYAQKLELDYLAEITMMQALKEHINVTCYDEFEVRRREDEPGWDIFIRMEMVTPVPEYIRTNPFTVGDAVLLGSDVCAMLEFCHPHEIVHRNICPQNIFVSADGVFKVGDYAIEDPNGRLLSTLTDLDAACYMAPEVYYGEDPDPASDIYSLGLLLYGLLNNNRLPFMPAYPQPVAVSDSIMANEKRFHGEPLPAPENAGEKLSAIILKACSYEIKDRYTSAAEMREALNEVLYSQTNEEPKTAAEEPTDNIYVPEIDYDKTTVGEAAIAVDSVKEVKKKKDRLTTALAIVAVLAVVLLSAFGVKYFLGDSEISDENPSGEAPSASAATDATEEVTSAGDGTVPSVVGMNADDAELLLTGLGYKVRIREAANENMAVNHVSAQSPVAKTQAPEGSVVVLTVSTGKQQGSVTAVSLDKTTATITVGQKVTLTARILPIDATNPAVAWSTSEPTVATVTADGVVSGVSVGTCIITATTVDGGKIATCAIAVVTPTDVVVTNQLNADKATAVAALEALGLTVTTTEQYSSTVAAGKVISQSLVAGATAKTGDTINLVISLGAQSDNSATTTTTPGSSTVSVTGITLSRTTMDLGVGTTGSLAATVAPSDATNKTYTWSSSNESVATVSGGVVTAKAVGTATITVTTADGGKTATCVVSVAASSVAVTGVTLSSTTASLTVGGTTTLTATVAPSNATDKTVTWTSSNSSVATVSGGTVTAKGAGTATITATASGKTATCTVTVTAASTTLTVNNVVGQTSAAAKKTLEDAGFKVSIAYVDSSSGNDTVREQKPSAGSSVEKGATVYLTVNRASVSITVIAQGNGTVTGSGMYAVGSSVTITAKADSGYKFVKWSDGNTTASRTITVGSSSAVYTAVFEKGTASSGSGSGSTTVAVTGVTLNTTALTLTEGKTGTLTATVAPSNATNKNCAWSSTDPSVATVSASGVVTAVKAGTAVILVVTADGNKTAACTVTVTASQEANG